jgi:hypothetical protein
VDLVEADAGINEAIVEDLIYLRSAGAFLLGAFTLEEV